ncbi:MAG: type IV toxin-antitoxin system AbiEi family antitoxin domain-containing protein [Candidatus Accumulibacter sp.]|uniref:Type IV toxin-antitoxin system AbiEi family antitoxin domain-containing protein n=1 Tax=Candidatus Accumulibacter affinis TaxID=2954384 RepID=A0A935TFM8_9PROT|nr:type IV toxin-antitoxin system AbiEi family antitoxin domain-containing protein [Candidatus Accumulibacter affinis]
MNATTKTAELIRQRIEGMPSGEPFTPTDLLACGTRASVDQTLSRLVNAGIIERVTRGVFVRPEVSRFVGRISPSPLQVAETIAKTTGSIVQVHGAEAARRLELTTQVPTQPVFSTSGPSKRIRVGKMEIRLQHVCQRKLVLAGRPAGLALAAMWYLGKTEVTPSLIEKIRHKLAPSEFEALRSATSAMPAWMSDAFFQNERAAASAHA